MHASGQSAFDTDFVGEIFGEIYVRIMLDLPTSSEEGNAYRIG